MKPSENQNQGAHVPTDIEIARAEAEAARAIAEGRAPQAQASAAPKAPQEEPQADFVPYVDDVEAEERARRQAEAEARLDAELGDDEDYIPSELEKRVAAIPEDKWKLYQIVGGAALGLAAAALLYFGNGDNSMLPLLAAAMLVLIGPNMFERRVRRKIPKARIAMVIALILGLVLTILRISAAGGIKSADNAQEETAPQDGSEAVPGDAATDTADGLEAPNDGADTATDQNTPDDASADAGADEAAPGA